MIKTTRYFSKLIVATSVVCLSIPAVAQDKLANMAPVDKKLKAIDSVALRELIREEALFGDPADNLYPDWSNEYTTQYGVDLPGEYKIDLRGFCMPTTSRLVTSHYGYRRSFRRQHYGTDLKVYVGDTIYAAFDGKVRVVDYNGGGYGKYIVIRHPNGLETLYGHLSRQIVHPDEMVKAGQPIGLGGNTGRSTGSHLHFETRLLGKFIDPEKLFNFEAQDVLADFYVFRSTGRGELLAAHDVNEPTPEELQAINDKARESHAFQEKKIAERQQARRSSVHKVKSGESLSSIAKKHHTTVKKLCKLNRISEKTVLRPGQILRYR